MNRSAIRAGWVHQKGGARYLRLRSGVGYYAGPPQFKPLGFWWLSPHDRNFATFGELARFVEEIRQYGRKCDKNSNRVSRWDSIRKC